MSFLRFVTIPSLAILALCALALWETARPGAFRRMIRWIMDAAAVCCEGRNWNSILVAVLAIGTLSFATACSDSTAPAPKVTQKWIAAITTDRDYSMSGFNLLVSRGSDYQHFVGWSGVLGMNVSRYNTGYVEIMDGEYATITHTMFAQTLNAKSLGLQVSITQTGNAIAIAQNIAAVQESVLQYTGAPDPTWLGDTSSIQTGPVGQSIKFNLLAGMLNASNIYSGLNVSVGIKFGCQNAATSYLSSSQPSESVIDRTGRSYDWRFDGAQLVKITCYRAEEAPASVINAMRAQQARLAP